MLLTAAYDSHSIAFHFVILSKYLRQHLTGAFKSGQAQSSVNHPGCTADTQILDKAQHENSFSPQINEGNDFDL